MKFEDPQGPKVKSIFGTSEAYVSTQYLTVSSNFLELSCVFCQNWLKIIQKCTEFLTIYQNIHLEISILFCLRYRLHLQMFIETPQIFYFLRQMISPSSMLNLVILIVLGLQSHLSQFSRHICIGQKICMQIVWNGTWMVVKMLQDKSWKNYELYLVLIE